jgi:hypothetical protein
MQRAALCVLLAVLATPAVAQAPSVDWKAYGGAKIDGQSVCFYDANGVVRITDGYPRAWTKCLPQKDMDDEFNDAIKDATAGKVVASYIPPIASVETLTYEQVLDVMRYEATADLTNIEPTMRIFYELDCHGRMLRELSTYIREHGKEGFDETPKAWKYIAPETNGARLLQMLCPAQ